MDTHGALDIHLAEQARLLTEIIHIMVGIEVEPSTLAWPPREEPLVEAIVRFTGPWSGAMIFESTLALSYEFTARFMTVPLPVAMDDDVRDAHGELANMIAGNFKALLPSGSRLSIPEVRLLSHSRASRDAACKPDAAINCCLCQSVFHSAYGDCCLTLADNSGHTCP